MAATTTGLGDGEGDRRPRRHPAPVPPPAQAKKDRETTAGFFKRSASAEVDKAAHLLQLATITDTEYVLLKRFAKYVAIVGPSADDKKSLRSDVSAEISRKQKECGFEVCSTHALLQAAVKQAKIGQFA
eukprot:137010-Pyramimonas_sp.AAC.1